MKKLIYLTLLLSTLQFSVNAQKEDNVWFVGGTWSAPGSLDTSFYKSCILNFSNNSVEIEFVSEELPFTRSNASICDSSGKFLCLSNGENLYNANYEIMENGGNFYPNNDYFYGYPAIQGFMLLPLPGSNDKVVHVYGNIKVIYPPNTLGYVAYFLRYGIADMAQNNGLGKVISKNLTGGTDTLAPTLITATRHGNGRDWWIMAQHYKDKIFYRYLLSPNGIKLIGSQTMEMKKLGLGQACFSPDGQWYACFNAHGRLPDSTFSTIELYRFDRCTGLLSDFREKTYSQNPLDGKPGGVAFSASSHFMYVSRWDTIYQYDMQAPDIFASEVAVAGYDGFQGEFGGGFLLPQRFYSLQLAPDHKIYCAVSNYSSRYLHVIDKPEEPGLACDVKQHSVYLPVYNEYALPNMPYYRLGKWAGSPCDTLGSVSAVEPLPPGEIKISPNPAADMLIVDFQQPLSGTLEIVNSSGAVMQSITLNKATRENIPTSRLANGLYFLRISATGQSVQTLKFIVAH